MLRGGNKVTPVVDGDAEEETRPAVGTGGGTAATAAATPPPENPGKAYNENVASVFRSQVLQSIGDDGRDKDGNILRDKLYKALAALYKSSSAPLDDDPARLAAALCFASTEPVTVVMSDDEAAALLERALEQRLEQQQQQQQEQQQQQQDASSGRDGGRVRAPPVPGVFSTIEEADKMHIYQSNEFLGRSLRDGKFTLVNAAYLQKLSAEGKKVPPCQELPDEARYKGPIDDESVLVLTISYCWASKAHPDPDGEILKELCELIEYLDESRHYNDWNDKVNGIGDKKIVVFLDYMSLPQKTAQSGITLLQMHAFNVGLMQCVNVLYASTCTMTILCTKSHEHCLDTRAAYLESGWPMFECLISMLIKDSDMVIDLPRALEWIRKMWTRPGDDDPGAQCNQSLYFLREDNRRATRRPPVHPNEFSKRVKTYTFTNNSDSDFVDGKYRTTYGDIVGFTKKVDYSDIPLALGDDWKLFLHQVLVSAAVVSIAISIVGGAGASGGCDEGDTGTSSSQHPVRSPLRIHRRGFVALGIFVLSRGVVGRFRAGPDGGGLCGGGASERPARLTPTPAAPPPRPCPPPATNRSETGRRCCRGPKKRSRRLERHCYGSHIDGSSVGDGAIRGGSGGGGGCRGGSRGSRLISGGADEGASSHRSPRSRGKQRRRRRRRWGGVSPDANYRCQRWQ